MKSNRRNFLLMAVCAVSLSACGSGGDSSSNSGESVKPSTVDGAIEKPSLKLGFIKLTDMAPLAIAKEKGFFAEEGLNVTLEPQANWKVLLDGVIGGQLDGAHMLISSLHSRLILMAMRSPFPTGSGTRLSRT